MNEAATTWSRLLIQRAAASQGLVLSLRGELDLATAPELDRQLLEIAHAGPGRLVVDLSGLEFMDSAGLSSLVAAQRRAEAGGPALALRRGAYQVQRLFELVGLSHRFTFED